MNPENLGRNRKKEKMKTNSKNIFKNLKSDYFLKYLFNLLEKNKFLSIIKYNKSIKKRMSINIQDYKDYSEIYSSIELEIKPVKNKYGDFININDKNEIYYHIYFDNKREEIKRNYLNENEKIKSIKIIIDYQIKTFRNLFYYCECIQSLNFKKFYRNNIDNMSFMFYNCSSLNTLNITNFNTNNVIDMRAMFYGCSSLKELNLNNFYTNNVSDMSGMFSGCSSLNKLNINNFNTNNVIYMNHMFYGCTSLEKLNLNNFNFKNVIQFNCMFSRCFSLKELKFNNFNADNVKYMSSMFSGCPSLKELNFNNFNANNLIDMSHMFLGCSYELKIKIKTQYKNIKEEAYK